MERVSSDQGAISVVATEAVSPIPGAASYRYAVKRLLKSVVREGAADKTAIQLVKVQSCQLPYIRHAAMPQLETGNWPGNAWCKRPSCSLPRGGAVGAIRGPSERRSLKVANDCSLEKQLPGEVAGQG